MPLSGLNVLDLSDLPGALCARLLADLGADVVRVEPPGGAMLRRLPSAHAYYDLGKRGVVIDATTPCGGREIAALAAAADVIVDAPAPSSPPLYSLAELRTASPASVLVRITPFGSSGPRAAWRGADLVCAARGGIAFVNGHPGRSPIAPFGLQAYNAAGVVGAIGALCALRTRSPDGTGGGVDVDVSIAAAAAALLEHATGLHRQTGAIESRRGTLHWSRTFRLARCRDGDFLLSLLGDWTSLVEWAVSEGADASLRDPRWLDGDARKQSCEEIFAHLDRWVATRNLAELAEGAWLRRLPLAPVSSPAALVNGEQLGARGWPARAEVTSGSPRGRSLPGPLCHLAATQPCRRRAAPSLGEHDVEVRADREWRDTRPRGAIGMRAGAASARARTSGTDAPRILDGIRVLDFTWVVAGPVATRILADQGAEVIKIEPRGAPDFGTRRGGLTGNLNRGKQSVVIDVGTARGLDLVRRLVACSDVLIENFSARVLPNWGLDDAALARLRPDLIAVHMSGFGRTGPWSDRVSYGPTLQALAGLPHLMRLPGEPPAGWGYSYSDMVAGYVAALATLAALHQRDRTGRGQAIDLAQLDVLVSLLGPTLIDALAGRDIAPPGNRSQEGEAAPHGIYRCAPEGRQGSTRAVHADPHADDDRWIAIAVLDDAAWCRFADLLARDGALWARDAAHLRLAAARVAEADAIDRRVAQWTAVGRAEEIEERLQAIGIAAGLVASAADLAADPQLAARGYFASLTTPEGNVETFDGVPFLCSHKGGRVAAPGPLLGEHTDAVLRRTLGIEPEELLALRAEKVIE